MPERALKQTPRSCRHRQHRAPPDRRPRLVVARRVLALSRPRRTPPTRRRLDPTRREWPRSVTLAQQRLDAARDQATEISGRSRPPRPSRPSSRPRSPTPRRRSRRCGPGPTELRTQVKERAAQLYVQPRRARRRSSRRWRPRAPRTACAPRTSPTPSATRTSTPPPSCARPRAKLAAREARAASTSAPTSRRRIADLAPLNDLLQQKLAGREHAVRQGARAGGRRSRRSTASTSRPARPSAR